MAAAVKISLLCVLLAVAIAHGTDHGRDAGLATYNDLTNNDEYFAEKRTRGIYYMKYYLINKNNCYFSGYAPNGPIKDIGSIKAPKATLGAKDALEAIIGKAAKKMGQGASVALAAIKFSAKLTEALGNLGPAMGLFSAMTNVLFPSPTPADMMASVNKAIKELTDEVNKKLDQMEGYVDSKVAKLEKKLIEKKYKTHFTFWGNCVKEVTAEQVLECQREAVRDLNADRESFADNHAAVRGFAKRPRAAKFETVRSLEAYVLAFRDYANLFIMAIVPLCQTYCETNKDLPDAAAYCNRYTGELKKEATFFVEYAKDAVAYIKAGHWGKQKTGACLQTIHCGGESVVREGFWNGVHTANRATCKCEIESSNTKKYCSFQYTRRMDGKRPSSYTRTHLWHYRFTSRAKMDYGRKILRTLAMNYQASNHKVMTAYWKTNLLSFVPEWEKAIALADKFSKMNPRSKDAPEADDEALFEPSPRFEARLAAASQHDI